MFALTATAPPALADRLLERARGGDVEAFTDLVREHERMVFSLALRLVRDRAQAEDVAQDAFLQLYRHLATLDSPEHVVHWLRRVTVNRAIDVARRGRVRPEVALEFPPEIALVRRDRDPLLARALRQLVDALPLRARTVVVLRFQEDMEVAEIAGLLGIPLNTVKSQLRRALAVLRARAGRLKANES